jgi:UDP-3-O-[3-hydroxymyristoyl] glucosamine N-acyltransferase
MQITLLEIANLVQGEIIGDGAIVISTLSSLDNVIDGSLVFAEGNNNLKIAAASAAAAVLVGDYATDLNKPMIRVTEPFAAFIILLKHFHPARPSMPGIHPTAIIAEDVVLGEGVAIGPYVVIESGCKIANGCVIKSHVHIGHSVTLGEQTTLHPQVTIYDHCRIGARVIIHASTVIGSDGFGYFFKEGEHMKVPHVGHVVIDDDVEIGANTVIDRATVGATRIGEGTKIDNLVQIAHSVQLGKHNILCAFTGIAGSSKSGNHVIFAANVGVSDHVTIDDGVVLGARTGVPPRKHLKHGNVYLGSPARVKDKAIEFELAATRIPMMRKNLLALTGKVKRLGERVARLDLEKEDS